MVFLIFVLNHLWEVGLAVLVLALVPIYASVSLCLTALLVEGAGGFAATTRSRRLTWRTPRILLLIGAMLLLVGVVAFVPGFIVSHLMSAGGAELLVEGLVGMAIASFVTPFSGAFIASAYLEARAGSGETIEPWMLAAALRTSDQR